MANEEGHVWEDVVEEINASLRDIMGIEDDDFELTDDDVAVITAILKGALATIDAFDDALVERAQREGG